METTMKSPLNAGMKFGLYTGLASITYFLIFYMMDIVPQGALQVIGYLIFIAGIYFGSLHHRNHELDGYMSYGRAFGAGALIVIFAALITAVFNYIFFAYIDPQYMDKMINMAEEDMIRKGMSEEQINMGMEMTRKWTTPPMAAIFGFVGYVFSGVILSLLVALVTKKNKPMFE
jgi:hypothetical protein